MMGPIVTAEELAEILKVPTSQIYRLARNGELPSIRLGKYVRFRLADVEDTFETRRAA